MMVGIKVPKDRTVSNEELLFRLKRINVKTTTSNSLNLQYANLFTHFSSYVAFHLALINPNHSTLASSLLV